MTGPQGPLGPTESNESGVNNTLESIKDYFVSRGYTIVSATAVQDPAQGIDATVRLRVDGNALELPLDIAWNADDSHAVLKAVDVIEGYEPSEAVESAFTAMQDKEVPDASTLAAIFTQISAEMNQSGSDDEPFAADNYGDNASTHGNDDTIDEEMDVLGDDAEEDGADRADEEEEEEEEDDNEADDNEADDNEADDADDDEEDDNDIIDGAMGDNVEDADIIEGDDLEDAYDDTVRIQKILATAGLVSDASLIDCSDDTNDTDQVERVITVTLRVPDVQTAISVAVVREGNTYVIRSFDATMPVYVAADKRTQLAETLVGDGNITLDSLQRSTVAELCGAVDAAVDAFRAVQAQILAACIDTPSGTQKISALEKLVDYASVREVLKSLSDRGIVSIKDGKVTVINRAAALEQLGRPAEAPVAVAPLVQPALATADQGNGGTSAMPSVVTAPASTPAPVQPIEPETPSVPVTPTTPAAPRQITVTVTDPAPASPAPAATPAPVQPAVSPAPAVIPVAPSIDTTPPAVTPPAVAPAPISGLDATQAMPVTTGESPEVAQLRVELVTVKGQYAAALQHAKAMVAQVAAANAALQEAQVAARAHQAAREDAVAGRNAAIDKEEKAALKLAEAEHALAQTESVLGVTPVPSATSAERLASVVKAINALKDGKKKIVTETRSKLRTALLVVAGAVAGAGAIGAFTVMPAVQMHALDNAKEYSVMYRLVHNQSDNLKYLQASIDSGNTWIDVTDNTVYRLLDGNYAIRVNGLVIKVPENPDVDFVKRICEDPVIDCNTEGTIDLLKTEGTLIGRVNNQFDPNAANQ